MKPISDYPSALTFFKQKQRLGIQPGLERVRAALDYLENPQDAYKVIHIAGTNGKGTVAATIASALARDGYKVGLFTSPWVLDYREQIQINGQFISKEDFCRGASMLQQMNTDCTEFESLCVLAYWYFKEQNVDFAVVECGMGGKGDATNVEAENLSVITAISLDHTDFLGSTIEEIAEEKSGILRKNGTCVLYNDELESIFAPKCAKLVTGNLKDNLLLVNAVLSELNIESVSDLVRLTARQERRGNILIDGGHNVAAAKQLAPLLHDEIAVIGMVRDKDVNGYLSLIAPKCKRIIAVSFHHPRAIPAQILAEKARQYCDDVIVENSAETALQRNPTLICGSFYMIREINNFI